MLSTYLPLVNILTPVFNGEKYLVECIESVLAQSYQNWDYEIVNNASTDETLKIAERYARRDRRIHVHNYEEFVDVIENHNRAFRLVSRDSKYCKVVSADDWLFPECVMRLVEIAEANPSVGIVGSYQLREDRVEWDGLPYTSTVVPGREICRWHLLGGPYVFGSPTSVLYRSDLIRGTDFFSPNLYPHADTSAFYKYLQNTDFGFSHQVLSYERVHAGAVSLKSRRIDYYVPACLKDLLEYVPIYLMEY
jgi:glycosyltransferase involved in cell wall biosynthesis